MFTDPDWWLNAGVATFVVGLLAAFAKDGIMKLGSRFSRRIARKREKQAMQKEAEIKRIIDTHSDSPLALLEYKEYRWRLAVDIKLTIIFAMLLMILASVVPWPGSTRLVISIAVLIPVCSFAWDVVKMAGRISTVSEALGRIEKRLAAEAISRADEADGT